MKKQVILLFIPGLVVFSACISREAFQPPPFAFESWLRPGSSLVDVQKALLECGYPNPHGTLPVGAKIDLESEAKQDRCMENAGFTYRNNRTHCEYSWAKELKNCQPDAVIPKRDLQTRLSSQYCRSNPQLLACQP